LENKLGIDIFVHSVRLVLNDWRTALRISIVPYLITAVPSLLFGLLFPPNPADPMGAAAGAGALGLISLVLYVGAFLWLAVTWHRYVLVDEVPRRSVPPFNQARMGAYFMRSLIIFGILLLISIAMMLVSAVAAMIFLPLAFIVSIIFYMVMAAVSYRLSPMLPAAALDRTMTVQEALAATDGANTQFIILAVVSVLAALVINLPVLLFAFLGGFGALLGLLWSLVTGWVIMLVGISLLTTIYGHFVEGRAIPKATA
jgi:hypothetical protein